MNGLPCVIALVGQIVNLGMAIVTGRYTVVRLCCQNLVRLEFPVAETRRRRRSNSCSTGWDACR